MQWYIFRELVKRLDPDLPFYLWTAQDPYDHPLVPFDGREDEDHGGHGYGVRHERLHRLQRNAREDPAIFVAGRALIPPRCGAALRQLPSFHVQCNPFIMIALGYEQSIHNNHTIDTASIY